MAGITQFKEFQKPSLAGIVDETVENRVNTFVDSYLPDGETFNSTFTYDILESNPQIAGVVGYGAEVPVADRNMVKRALAEVAKMGLKYVVTEEEQLALHNARSDAEHRAMVNHLMVESSGLVDAILKRVYVQKVQAIIEGKFKHNANGVKLDIDLGLDAVKTPLALWDSATTVDIIGDLTAWVQEFEDNNKGESPSEIIMSREVMAVLMKNEEFLAHSGTLGTVTRVKQAVVNEILADFNLPPIRVITHKELTFKDIYTGNEITETIFMPERILLLGSNLGEYKFGPTVENNFTPGINLSAYDKNEPIESVIKAVAAGFPAIVKPKKIMRADVIS